MYEHAIPSSVTTRLRKLYLRSYSPTEARGYYLVLMASNTDDATQAESLFVEAEESMPDRPISLNNRGWHYATHPDLSNDGRRKAVEYALAGWAYEPNNPNFIDTVACAFAANEQWHLALVMEDHAITLGRGGEHEDAIKENRQRIAQEQLCQP